MTKSIAWSQTSKNDLMIIKKFFDTLDQSTTYSEMLIKIFRNSANLIEKFSLLSIPTEYNNVRGIVRLKHHFYQNHA